MATKSYKLSHWIFVLRIAMGWLFFWAGLSKLLNPDWSAEGFLLNSTGVFADLFVPLAGNAVVDFLNMWGLLLIGVALLLGVLVRWASFWGIVLNVLYFVAVYPARGDFGVLIDDHIIYIFVLIGFMIFGAGEHWGLDNWIERTKFYKRNKWLHWVLG